ncbi:hypothetical protein LS684_04260 [Cytobacillus spongiae]|uniref:hypothetical protein n=1 Tax=Cytobacillus spongiae TaxID=2901381 RepID=UPI001F3D6F5D|nr:hypothetical protein [Cytobacillus spongiae]UII56685.1 hypothetical protein LS684_04260 [Cytobacillus spongiae]
MTREEKREIRIKIHQVIEKDCKGCPIRYHEQAQMCNSLCPVGEELQLLASNLIGDDYRLQRKKNKRPEDVHKGRWNEEEELYLLHHMDLYPTDHLAKKLNRHPQSVYNKIVYFRKRQQKIIC